jgi:hypothetical protein
VKRAGVFFKELSGSVSWIKKLLDQYKSVETEGGGDLKQREV